MSVPARSRDRCRRGGLLRSDRSSSAPDRYVGILAGTTGFAVPSNTVHNRVNQILNRVSAGLLTIYLQHTSASLLIQENASPDVRRDLDAFLRRIVPENAALYHHNDEGPDDMPAHIRSALTQTQLTIPVTDGRLQLGTWQGIFLLEHRNAPHRRSILLTLIGEDEGG